jgi:hypothetical protein
MEDGSHRWFYSGNWYDWDHSGTFGLESVSPHLAESPAASLDLARARGMVRSRAWLADNDQTTVFH